MTVKYKSVGERMNRIDGCTIRVVKWRPQPSVRPWLVGQAGTRNVEIIGDPYNDERSTIKIDGVPAKITYIERYRDGGTTIINTDRGEIYYPAPQHRTSFPKVKRSSTLDGVEIIQGELQHPNSFKESS